MAIVITKLVGLHMEGDPEGRLTQVYPEFCIIKSQFCRDPDDETFVTIGLGGGTEITKAQLLTRALDIHTRLPFMIPEGDVPNPMRERTTAEVETMVNDWCTEKNAS